MTLSGFFSGTSSYNLSFCTPFHMSSESCHGLTTPYSNTSTSSSPSSRICWVSLMISFKVHLILLAAMTSVCSQTQTERPRAHIFSSVAVEFGTPWSGLDIYRQVMGTGYYSGWDTGDIFRGSCPSGHWPVQMPSSSPSRRSVSEVLCLYLTSLWIRNPNAFAGHLSQQHWQSSWKYFSFLAGLSQQLYGSISWNPQIDSSSMLSKTLWNVGQLINKTSKRQSASNPLDENKWSRPFWRYPV